jgi:hypothetical protein
MGKLIGFFAQIIVSIPIGSIAFLPVAGHKKPGKQAVTNN